MLHPAQRLLDHLQRVHHVHADAGGLQPVQDHLQFLPAALGRLPPLARRIGPGRELRQTGIIGQTGQHPIAGPGQTEERRLGKRQRAAALADGMGQTQPLQPGGDQHPGVGHRALQPGEQRCFLVGGGQLPRGRSHQGGVQAREAARRDAVQVVQVLLGGKHPEQQAVQIVVVAGCGQQAREQPVGGLAQQPPVVAQAGLGEQAHPLTLRQQRAHLLADGRPHRPMLQQPDDHLQPAAVGHRLDGRRVGRAGGVLDARGRQRHPPVGLQRPVHQRHQRIGPGAQLGRRRQRLQQHRQLPHPAVSAIPFGERGGDLISRDHRASHCTEDRGWPNNSSQPRTSEKHRSVRVVTCAP